MALEIEKRFLLKPVDIEELLKSKDLLFKKVKIEQFYVSSSKDGVERYRKVGDSFIHTIKRGFGLIREEYEERITKKEYLNQKRKVQNKRLIKKDRYITHFEDNILEIDSFKGFLKGLLILEVEFYDKKSFEEFKFPEFLKPFLIRDITNDIEFTNGYLSKVSVIPSIKYELKDVFWKIENQNSVKIPKIKFPMYQSIQDSLRIFLFSAFIANKRAFEIDSKNQKVLFLYESNKIILETLELFAPYFKKKWYKNSFKNIKNVEIILEKDKIATEIINFSREFKSYGKFLEDALENEDKKLLKVLEKDLRKRYKRYREDNFQIIKRELENIDPLQLKKIEKKVIFKKKALAPTLFVIKKSLKKRVSNLEKLLKSFKKKPLNSTLLKIKREIEFFSLLNENFKSVIEKNLFEVFEKKSFKETKKLLETVDILIKTVFYLKFSSKRKKFKNFTEEIDILTGKIQEENSLKKAQLSPILEKFLKDLKEQLN
jgi:CYTH domain-containing protein